MIIEQIKNELMILNQKFIDEAEDNYDYWNNHIKYVVQESKRLAKKYNADLEIVELGALLHDIASVAKVGTKADHHTNGAILAKNLLEKYNYPKNKIDKVVGCVLNHRSSKHTTNIDELCVADADIISHFYNLPNSIILGVKKYRFNNAEQLMDWIARDYNDLSDQTKLEFKDRYNNIMKTLFCDLWTNI